MDSREIHSQKKLDSKKNSQEVSQKIIEILSPFVSEERKEKILSVVNNRDSGLFPVLENIYDRGNISAVLRSAEAFGYYNCSIISPNEKFKNSKRVTQGAEKWLNIKEYKSTSECLKRLRNDKIKIVVTSLERARPIDEINFENPTALVLGNEKDGASREILDEADERVIIPMNGFIQSFNISVAAAICFYHIHQRRKVNMLDMGEDKWSLIAEYYKNSVKNAETILKARI